MKDIKINLDLTEVVAIQDAKLQGVCLALVCLILELCKTETVDRENLYKRMSSVIRNSNKHKHEEQVRTYIEIIRSFISPDQKMSDGVVVNFPEPAPETP
ncbi:hypothetical protein [Microbulbifer sp. TYP-18]|uniref:hypothetical protein n=1 Tax=Microbulbifer sp. TYP-18 TaxID=3230024 RepID=UPI0034C62183